MPASFDKSVAAIEAIIGYTFKDKENLKSAITHSSTGAKRNYERLEFLGDRVLNLVVADELFTRFADETEGDLAKRHAALVQGRILARIARRLNIGTIIKLSAAERAAGGAENDNILADILEATIGALFREAGLDECRRVILTLWGADIEIRQKPPRDAKTGLQEWAQAKGLGLPTYTLISRDGPDHAPLFEIEVCVEGHPPTKSKGSSRRKAEKQAAAMLLTHLEEMES
jgi:ribonuclease-3